MSQVKAGAAYVELTTRNSKFLKGWRQRRSDCRTSVRRHGCLGDRLMGFGAAATAPIAGSMAVFTSFDDAMRGVRRSPKRPMLSLRSCVTRRRNLVPPPAFRPAKSHR